jgi:aspartyl-tRNA(Asn)/glutamyl-tRNA(Gln) amidotransferase subunit A
MQISRREFGFLVGAAAVAETVLGNWPAWAATATGEALTSLTLAEASAKIHAGTVTPTQLTTACLDRISIYAPKLDCFITVMRDKALAQAAALDAEAKAGKFRGPLHGIPIALKDNIDTAGTLTTAGSGVFKDRVPTENAPVVTRLMDAGAIIIGKTNLHEFAFGGGDVSYFGPPRNPWNLAHNTGGSSSGSGAAMSADLCYAALGTDTGGSIRMPSAYCAVVGIKPTVGLVPIRGIAPLRASLDHCGPLAKRVEDCALMLNVMAGYDKLDIFSVDHPKEDYVKGMRQPVAGFRLGIPQGGLDPGANGSAEVIAIVKTAIDLLGTMTAGPAKNVTMPALPAPPPSIAAATAAGGAGSAVAAAPGLANAGASGSAAAASTAAATPVPGAGPGGGANPLGPETLAFHDPYFRTKAELYQPTIRKSLEQIVLVNESAEDYVSYHWKLELLRRTVDDAFTDFDLVVMPTQKTEPPVLNDMIKRNMENVRGIAPAGGRGAGAGGGGGVNNVSSTGAYDTYGLPSLSVPCGFTKDGLPVGLMICGPHFSESKVLALAAAYEKATQWHTKKPPLTPDTPVPELITHL